MRAPTHVTGPDGKICAKGEEIPDDWFDRVPDLRAVIESLGPVAVDTEVAVEPTEEVPIEATVTMKRKRTTS